VRLAGKNSLSPCIRVSLCSSLFPVVNRLKSHPLSSSTAYREANIAECIVPNRVEFLQSRLPSVSDSIGSVPTLAHESFQVYLVNWVTIPMQLGPAIPLLVTPFAWKVTYQGIQGWHLSRMELPCACWRAARELEGKARLSMRLL
jgi:hypothetical protein